MAKHKSPRQFSVAFKIDTVKKVLDGTYESQSDAARKLGTSSQVVNRWVAAYQNRCLSIDNAIAVSSKPDKVVGHVFGCVVMVDGEVIHTHTGINAAVQAAKKHASNHPNCLVEVIETKRTYSVINELKEVSYV